MREIKFRFWAKDKKKMNYPFNAKGNILHIFIRSDGKICEITDEYLVDDIKYLYVPLQYTGLKDKNGKEIYEGDIVKVLTSNLEPKHNAEVTMDWVNGLWSWTCIYNKSHYSLRDSEVIGNIYENPELIK